MNFAARSYVTQMKLIEKADPNIQNQYGWTPLMFASTNDRFQVIELLPREKVGS